MVTNTDTGTTISHDLPDPNIFRGGRNGELNSKSCCNGFSLKVAVFLIAILALGLGLGLGFGLGFSKDSSRNKSQINQPSISPNVEGITTSPPIQVIDTSHRTSPPTKTPVKDIRAILTDQGVLTVMEDSSDFSKPWKYQARAVESLSFDGVVVNYSNEKILQRYVLKCVYFETNRKRTAITDAAWGMANFPYWREPRGWDDHEIDECLWYGVTCNSDGFVTKIDLTDTQLTGNIPKEITLLSNSFSSLILDDNIGIGGPIPSFFGDLLSLTNLSLIGTSFSGSPPIAICNLNLVVLECNEKICQEGENCCTNCG